MFAAFQHRHKVRGRNAAINNDLIPLNAPDTNELSLPAVFGGSRSV